MNLKGIFEPEEFDGWREEVRNEEAFQRKADASAKEFKLGGSLLLAAGDFQGLRQLFVRCAVDPAMDEDGREWEVLDRIDRALLELIGEIGADNQPGIFDGI